MANPDLVLRVSAQVDAFVEAMRGVTAQAAKAMADVEKSFSGFDKIGARMAGVGTAMSAAISLPLEELGRHALEAASQFEQTQVAFTTFLGSAENAMKMTKDLYAFAASTPFQIQGIMQGSRQLLAMRFSAKDTIPILRVLGDTAAGLGLGQDGMDRLIFHMSQIQSLGRLDGRILRELGQQGVDAAEILAESFGKTVPQIHKMISAGTLDATSSINALLKGLNSEFGGMMSGMMGTLSGQFSNLKDRVTLTLVAIGQALTPVAKQFLDFGSKAADSLKGAAESFNKLADPIKAANLAIVGTLVVLGPLTAGLGGVLMLLAPVAAAFSIGVGTLVLYGLAVTGVVAGLAALGVWTATHWAGVKAMVSQAWTGVKEIWAGTIGTAIDWAKALFEGFYSHTRGIWEYIGASMKRSWDGWVSLGQAFVAAFRSTVIEPFIGIAKLIAVAFKSGVIDPIVDTFQILSKVPGVSKVITEMGDAFAKAGAKVQDGIAKISGSGEAFSRADAAAQKAKATADRIAADYRALKMDVPAPPQIASPKDAWNEKHAEKIKEYSAAVADLTELYKQQEIPLEKLVEAQDRLAKIRAEKQPKFDTGEDGAGAAPKMEFHPITPPLDLFLKGLEMQKAKQGIIAAQAAFDQFTQRVENGEIATAAGMIGDKLWQMGELAHKGAVVSKDSFKAIAEAINEPFERLKKAWETLGVVSSHTLKMQADDAKQAYLLIEKSGTAAGDDIKNAWIAMTEAQMKADEALNKQIPLLQRVNLALKQMDMSWGTAVKNFGSNTFTALGSSFTNMITGLLNGTKKFKAAWLELGSSMLSSFASSLAQMATQWATHLALKLAKYVLTSLGMGAVDETTDTTATAAAALKNVAQIAGAAALGAANAWAATAAIPIVGPELAPGVAASTFAGIASLMALGSAEHGAVLPNMSSMMLLHPNEMVLPGYLSRGFQAMLKNGNGGGGHQVNQSINHTMNIHNAKGINNRDVERLSRQIPKHIAKHFRNGALPRLAGI